MQFDWNQEINRLIRMSADHRPDAVTWDKLVDHDLGPVSEITTDEGLDSWIWRAYIEGNQVWLQRVNEAGDDWEDPYLLVDIGGTAPAHHLSLTFDQTARAWVSWIQDGSMYIYWFDPQQGTRVIREIGPGRTPVMRIDYRYLFDLGASDILLFYVNESTDQVELLRQRDRFNDPIATGITPAMNVYLELLAKARNYRLYLYFSEHDPATGRYKQLAWHSAPYPFFMERENITRGADRIEVASTRQLAPEIEPPSVARGEDKILDASTDSIIRDLDLSPSDLIHGSDEISGASVRSVVIDREPDEEEVTRGTDTITGGSSVQVIIEDEIEPDSTARGPDEITGGSTQ